MAHISTEEKFLSAIEIIRNLPKSGPIQPSNDTKLKFYSYFKQATEGPCEGSRPGFWDVVNRAKWDAWNKLGNMSKEDAMKRYVEEFVRTLEESPLDELDGLDDPNLVNEYSSIMGPYIEYAPKAVQDYYMLMNGKGKKSLNNNSEDHLEADIPVTGNNSVKDYKNNYTSKPTDEYPTPLNGHTANGNDSDSDEFSDTLERVNEDDSTEASLSHSKPTNDNDLLISAKGPNIVNARGGWDQRLRASNNSAGGASSGNGGNHMPQPQGSGFPSHPPSHHGLIGGSGRRRRSGEGPSQELSSEVGEQLAMAVIRLQHIMEQVVVRLDSLETLLTERNVNNSLQLSSKKGSRWSIFGVSPKLAILILAWPFIAQWLMFIIRKRQRQH